MKFKFCGEGDCPLWALAALHALGALPAPLFRDLLDRVFSDQPDDEIMEILKDTSLASRSECARAAAAARWVVRSACACACPGAALARDLAVLGVPRAHALALAAAADAARARHEDAARDSSFTVNKLTDVMCSAAPPGAVDSYTLTLHSETSSGEHTTRELLIEKTQASTLLQELKKVYQKMELMTEDA